MPFSNVSVSPLRCRAGVKWSLPVSVASAVVSTSLSVSAYGFVPFLLQSSVSRCERVCRSVFTFHRVCTEQVTLRTLSFANKSRNIVNAIAPETGTCSLLCAGVQGKVCARMRTASVPMLSCLACTDPCGRVVFCFVRRAWNSVAFPLLASACAWCSPSVLHHSYAVPFV